MTENGQGTNYIVLRRLDNPDSSPPDLWEQITAQYARSARAAIRQALEGTDLEGEFIAVPARSWRPVTVKVETKTALKFS